MRLARRVAAKKVNCLLSQGVEVQRAQQWFTHEGRVYGEGTYVVSMGAAEDGRDPLQPRPGQEIISVPDNLTVTLCTSP
jgi:hypothetical protein